MKMKYEFELSILALICAGYAVIQIIKMLM